MSEQVIAGKAGRRAMLMGGIACVALVCAFCWPMATGGVPYLADISQTYFPLADHLGDSLWAGGPQFWIDDLAGGYFAHGAGQSGMMYPVYRVLYRLVPMPWAFSVNYLLHLALAAAGFFVLLRGHGLRALSCVLGAMLYTFNGHVAGHHVHTDVMPSIGWLPWVLVAARGMLAGPSGRSFGWLALAWGMMALAGHPQWTWLGSLVVLGYVLIGPGHESLRLGRRALLFVGAGALALVVAAAQVLPTAATAMEIDRGGDDKAEFATSFSLTMDDLPRLLCPNVHGNPATEISVVESAQWWETAGFQGAAALCLAIFFFAAYRPGRLGWFAAALIVVGLAMAFGQSNPVYAVLAKLPVLGNFRAAARYLLLALIGISVAAACGLDRVLRGDEPDRPAGARWAGFGGPAASVGLIALGNLFFAGMTWAFTSPLNAGALKVEPKLRTDVIHNYFVGWEPVVIALAAIATGVLFAARKGRARRGLAVVAVVLCGLELMMFWRSFVVTAPASYYLEPPAYLRDLHDTMHRGGRLRRDMTWEKLLVVKPPEAEGTVERTRTASLECLAPIWGMVSLSGIEPLQPWEAVNKRNRAAAALLNKDRKTALRGKRICDVAGINWVVSTDDLSGLGFELSEGSTCLWYNPDRAEGVYAAGNVVPAPDLREQRAAPERESFRAGLDVAMDPAMAEGVSGATADCGELFASGWREHTGRIAAAVWGGPGVLVVQQNWHKGWRATVDGKPAPVVRCNASDIGVPFPGSDGEDVKVELRFESPETRVGGWLSLLGLVICVGLLWMGGTGVRRPKVHGLQGSGYNVESEGLAAVTPRDRAHGREEDAQREAE